MALSIHRVTGLVRSDMSSVPLWPSGLLGLGLGGLNPSAHSSAYCAQTRSMATFWELVRGAELQTSP